MTLWQTCISLSIACWAPRHSLNHWWLIVILRLASGFQTQTVFFREVQLKLSSEKRKEACCNKDSIMFDLWGHALSYCLVLYDIRHKHEIYGVLYICAKFKPWKPDDSVVTPIVNEVNHNHLPVVKYTIMLKKEQFWWLYGCLTNCSVRLVLLNFLLTCLHLSSVSNLTALV